MTARNKSDDSSRTASDEKAPECERRQRLKDVLAWLVARYLERQMPAEKPPAMELSERN